MQNFLNLIWVYLFGFSSLLANSAYSEDMLVVATEDISTEIEHYTQERSNSSSKSSSSHYQIEVLLFKQPKNLIKGRELFTVNSKSINKSGSVNFFAHTVSPKFLLRDYELLKNKYEVILYTASEYKLFPGEKTKKFVISSEHSGNSQSSVLTENADFEILLSIIQVKNNLNVIFNGKVEQYSLYRSAKLKFKESYYFDHPMFGALVNITGLSA